jgi:lactoylglutathione lyase
MAAHYVWTMTRPPSAHGPDIAASSLGAFSISLPVEDLPVSKAFYERLGFTATGGDDESWMILMNGPVIVGLFQGMFDKPMLTFNPGWANDTSELDAFTDVRVIKDQLVAAGVTVESDTTGDSENGPASFAVFDPDGNPILIDQHR